MVNTTEKTLDEMRVQYVFRKYMEEYGIVESKKIIEGLQIISDVQAHEWGIDIRREYYNEFN